MRILPVEVPARGIGGGGRPGRKRGQRVGSPSCRFICRFYVGRPASGPGPRHCDVEYARYVTSLISFFTSFPLPALSGHRGHTYSLPSCFPLSSLFCCLLQDGYPVMPVQEGQAWLQVANAPLRRELRCTHKPIPTIPSVEMKSF